MTIWLPGVQPKTSHLHPDGLLQQANERLTNEVERLEAEVAQARAALHAALLNEAEVTIATLRAALQAAHAVLADVRPMLCDILKLCSDISAGDDYEAVARVIDRIDALQANRSTAREIDLGAADAPQSRADVPREDRTVPSSTVEGLAEHQSLSFSDGAS